MPTNLLWICLTCPRRARGQKPRASYGKWAKPLTEGHGKTQCFRHFSVSLRPRSGDAAPACPGFLARCGVDAGLVDEHEAGGVDPGQLVAPHPPRLGHVLPVLLGGLDRLFFRTRPSALSARHRAEALRRTPVRSASRSAYSARVASFRSATSPASASRSPPSGVG